MPSSLEEQEKELVDFDILLYLHVKGVHPWFSWLNILYMKL